MSTETELWRTQGDNEADEDSRFNVFRAQLETGARRVRYVISLGALLVVLALIFSFLK